MFWLAGTMSDRLKHSVTRAEKLTVARALTTKQPAVIGKVSVRLQSCSLQVLLGSVKDKLERMSALAKTVPGLVDELGRALASQGRGDVISQIESGVIALCTYDQSVDAGYIYLVCPAPSRHFENLAAPVAETIPFLRVGLNVDVDHDGHIFGIEFLSRPDVLAQLRDANAL